jgi:hypothetical protein
MERSNGSYAGAAAAAGPVVASDHDFNDAISSLQGSFLKHLPVRWAGEHSEQHIAFFNGSVADFMIKRVHTDGLILRHLFKTAATLRQLDFLFERLGHCESASYTLAELATVYAKPCFLHRWNDTYHLGQKMLHSRALQPAHVDNIAAAVLKAEDLKTLHCSAALTALRFLLLHASFDPTAHADEFNNICTAVMSDHTSSWEEFVTVLAEMRTRGWPIEPEWMAQLHSEFERHAEGWWDDEGSGHRRNHSQRGWTRLLRIAEGMSPEFRAQLHAKYGDGYADGIANPAALPPSRKRHQDFQSDSSDDSDDGKKQRIVAETSSGSDAALSSK